MCWRRLPKKNGWGSWLFPKTSVLLLEVVVRILKDDELRSFSRRPLEELAPRFFWDEEARPLIEFAAVLRKATDSEYMSEVEARRRARRLEGTRLERWVRGAPKVPHEISNEGLRASAKRIGRRLVAQG